MFLQMMICSKYVLLKYCVLEIDFIMTGEIHGAGIPDKSSKK